MASIGELNSVTVDPASDSNGAVTTYTVNAVPPNSLTNGDIFQFDIPSEISVPSSVACTPGSGLYAVSCVMEINTLKATLTFTESEDDTPAAGDLF